MARHIRSNSMLQQRHNLRCCSAHIMLLQHAVAVRCCSVDARCYSMLLHHVCAVTAYCHSMLLQYAVAAHPRRYGTLLQHAVAADFTLLQLEKTAISRHFHGFTDISLEKNHIALISFSQCFFCVWDSETYQEWWPSVFHVRCAFATAPCLINLLSPFFSLL